MNQFNGNIFRADTAIDLLTKLIIANSVNLRP